MLGINIQQILMHALNFVILFAALYFLLYKPVKNFMAKRNEYYDEVESKTNKLLDEANAAKEEYDSKLAGADDEIKKLKAEAVSKGTEEAAKIRADAEKEAEEIIESAKAKAEKNAESIVKSAESDVVTLAQEAAQKLIIEDSSEAYDSFLASVDTSDFGDNE